MFSIPRTIHIYKDKRDCFMMFDPFLEEVVTEACVDLEEVANLVALDIFFVE